MTDLGSVIEGLGAHEFTVTRTEGETYAKGRRVLGTVSTFVIRASWQPSGGDELQRAPEADRQREARTLFVASGEQEPWLSTGDVDSPADSVEMDGVQWEVYMVEDWRVAGGYMRAMVLRVPQRRAP